MRRAAKRDSNEAEIVQSLEDLGLFVIKISQSGLPDLLVYDPWAIHGPRLLCLEVKTPSGTLTPAQQKSLLSLPRCIVRNPEEILPFYGVTN